MEKKKESIKGVLNEATLNKLAKDYEADPKNIAVRNSFSRSTITDVSFDSASKPGIDPHFSLELKTLPVANQKQSGRCWIFAGLNFLREGIAKKNKITSFELSQNYISLFDKIEKANFILESLVSLANEDPSERLLSYLLAAPVTDGGQWDMFANLVHKYGLVPQTAFPETFQSEHTSEGSFLVNSLIREFAFRSHKMALKKQNKEIRSLKEETLEKIYVFYFNAFGVPPKKFDFEYYDEKQKYHVERNLTPKSFYDKYVGDAFLFSFQSCINSPTNDKPFGKNFTVDYLGNVLEGNPINHLNLEMKRMKDLIIQQLKDGTPVWFGSDVSFYRDRSSIAWDDKGLNFVASVGFDNHFEKGAMLDYHHSAMNHAMLITGVDLIDGKPVKWKIENSWGDSVGVKGYYVMSDSYFDTFVYQAVINKKFLNEKEKKAVAAEPIHLKPWDPMGSLAD